MKNIYQYIYVNNGIRMFPVLLFALWAERYQEGRHGWTFLLGFFIFLSGCYRGSRGIRNQIRMGTDPLEIRRDFVYAQKFGKVCVGESYLYLWKNMILYVLPFENIEKIYPLAQVVNEIYDHETVKNKYYYLCIEMRSGQVYKCSMSKGNLERCLIAVP